MKLAERVALAIYRADSCFSAKAEEDWSTAPRDIRRGYFSAARAVIKEIGIPTDTLERLSRGELVTARRVAFQYTGGRS